MSLFYVGLIISSMFFIGCIIFAIITYQRKRNSKIINLANYDGTRKKDNRSMLFSVFCLIFSIFSMLWTLLDAIPVPTIYPLDNEAKLYDGPAEVYIDSYPLLTTYYTIDGSNPEYGDTYKNTFTVTKTTTVSAKNRFLVFWSELSQNTFRFENAQNITVNHAVNNPNDNMTSEDIFTYCIIIIMLLIVLVSAIKGESGK